MNIRTVAAPSLFVALVLPSLGCEVPAAKGTVEITIQNLSPRDLEPEGRLLGAVAGLSGGACSEGPCSPNPCNGDPQGKSQCVGMGDLHVCQCPAGRHLDEMETCIADTECLPSTCNQRGECTQMDALLTCVCEAGYTGPNCRECDPMAGFFPDGLGGCSEMVDVCREGQGTEAFQQIIADAEAELGYAPTELELTGARLELVEGTALGVRSWDYLWNEEITLFVQTVGGFPIDAGVAEVPPAEMGLEPLEFTITLDRPTTSADERFLSGDFKVGIIGPSDRLLTEEFGADLKLVMDFAAY